MSDAGDDLVDRYLIISIIALFLVGCGSVSALSTQTADSTPDNEELFPTPDNQISSINDEIDKFTQDLHDRIDNCISFRDVFDFTFEDELIGHQVGTKKMRECIAYVLDTEHPEQCQGCQDLVPLVEMFSDQTLESMKYIDEGYDQNKSFYISEGLITFWDADIIWGKIKITIKNIRSEYNLPPIN